MTRRVVIGPRNNGDVGVFVSPSGVDAYTAADSSLVLGITSGVSQLVMLTSISSNQTITLGFGHSPFVFLTTYIGLYMPDGSGVKNGPTRPSPQRTLASDGHGGITITNNPPAYATINSGGASVSVVAPSKTLVAIYNKAFQ